MTLFYVIVVFWGPMQNFEMIGLLTEIINRVQHLISIRTIDDLYDVKRVMVLLTQDEQLLNFNLKLLKKSRYFIKSVYNWYLL